MECRSAPHYAEQLIHLTTTVFRTNFRDFHGRATYALSGGVRLAVTAYAGKDVLNADFAEYESDSLPSRAGQGGWDFDWGNRVLGATLSKDVGKNVTIEQRVSASAFSTRLDLGDGAFAQRSSISDVRAAGSLQAAEERRYLVRFELAPHRIRYARPSRLGRASSTSCRGGVGRLGTTLGICQWLVEEGTRGSADWTQLGSSLHAFRKYFATQISR